MSLPTGVEATPDPLLRAWLSGDAMAEEALERLVRDEALPVIRGIALARLGRDRYEDIDDISNEIVLQLLRRLRAARDDEDSAPMTSFRGYVATAASRGCDAYLRGRYPERHRLRGRVQYVASRHPRFFIEERDGRILCGLASERERPGDLQSSMLSERRYDDASLRGNALVHTLTTVLGLAGGAVELDAVVSLLARGIEVQFVEPENVADSVADIGVTLEQQSSLRKLWAEVAQLPRPQRVALLLNLRSASGEELMSFLPLLGIVSISAIAAALEIPALQFATIWNELPWTDARIGELLGVTRQQVINLRKSARERLVRRTRS